MAAGASRYGSFLKVQSTPEGKQRLKGFTRILHRTQPDNLMDEVSHLGHLAALGCTCLQQARTRVQCSWGTPTASFQGIQCWTSSPGKPFCITPSQAYKASKAVQGQGELEELPECQQSACQCTTQPCSSGFLQGSLLAAWPSQSIGCQNRHH